MKLRKLINTWIILASLLVIAGIAGSPLAVFALIFLIINVSIGILLVWRLEREVHGWTGEL